MLQTSWGRWPRKAYPGFLAPAGSRGQWHLRDAVGPWRQSGDAAAKVAELYSPPRVTAELGRLPYMSLVGGPTFDLRCDANGVTSEFRRAADRRRAREQIKRERPFLVVGSPPCTQFCSTQSLNHGRVGADEL